MNRLRGKAAVLAIGTELTTGQVMNRNAPWISQKLVSLGLEVVIHEMVADDRYSIEHALRHCAELSQFIFVTGGLGPTSDDFTREVISQWLGQPLEFYEPSWKKIVERLESFGVPVAPSNRQQCFFPQGSEMIPNPEGTAEGFSASFGQDSALDQRVWVLPGPPREVSAVWQQGIEQRIRGMVPEARPQELLTWQCLGKSEAELGELTEKALIGSQLQVGYRAHRPFVEVKVWIPQGQEANKRPWLEKLEQAIGPWIWTKQGEDLVETLLDRLTGQEYISVMDRASQGGLVSRVGRLLESSKNFLELKNRMTWLTEFGHVSQLEEWASLVLQHSDEDALTLVFGGFTEDGRSVVGLRDKGRICQEVIQSPWSKLEFLEQTRLFSTEVALKRWVEWLS